MSGAVRVCRLALVLVAVSAMAQATECPWLQGVLGTGPAQAVVVDGTLAYVGNGQELLVADVSSPATPVALGRVALPGDVFEIERRGSLLYVADEAGGFVVVDASDPTAPAVAGSVPMTAPQYYPVAVELSPAGELAFVACAGVPFTFLVVDVSDPAAPAEVARIAATWAEDLQLVGSYAYLVGPFGLMIVDVSVPTSPAVIGSTLSSLHGEAVSLADGRLWMAAGDDGIQVLDLSDPAAPAPIATVAVDAYDLAVDGGYAFVTNGYRTLQVVDIDPLGSASVVWSTVTDGLANGVAVQGNHVFVADGANGLATLRVDPGPVITELGALETAGVPVAAALRPGRAVVLDDVGNLRVLDVSDPAAPFEAARSQDPFSSEAPTDLAVFGDLAVKMYEHGFAVYRLDGLAAPTRLSGYGLGGDRVVISWPFAFVQGWLGELEVVDLSDPAAPQPVGTLSPPCGTLRDIAFTGDTIVAVCGTGFLADVVMIDVSTPAVPHYVGGAGLLGSYHVAAEGETAVAVDAASLEVLDLAGAQAPAVVASLALPGLYIRGVEMERGFVYVASLYGGLTVVDVRNPRSPVMVDSAPAGRAAENGLAVWGDRALVLQHTAGVRLFDLASCLPWMFADGLESGDTTAWSGSEP